MTDLDTPFSIARIEAFHVRSTGDAYWRDFKSENRVAGGRYLLKEGWRTAYGRFVETCLVKVTLEDGAFGWGEATEPVCPEVVGILAAGFFGDLLPGQRFIDRAAFRDFAYDLNRCRGHASGYQLLAIAALDIAICDALGRRAGVAIAGRPVPVYLSGLRQGTREARVAFWAERHAEGFGGVKLFGDADTGHLLAEIDALREGVPGDWDIMVDSLWTMQPGEGAHAAAKAFAGRGVGWWECPFEPEALEPHRALCEASAVPVALGEHFFTAYQVDPWFAPRALDVFQPDIGRTGLAGGLALAARADANGIAVTPHMGTGSPVVQAAALSFHAAIAGRHLCELQLELSALYSDIIRSGWTRRGGAMVPDETPGIGVEVDDAALRKVAVGAWSSAA